MWHGAEGTYMYRAHTYRSEYKFVGSVLHLYMAPGYLIRVLGSHSKHIRLLDQLTSGRSVVLKKGSHAQQVAAPDTVLKPEQQHPQCQKMKVCFISEAREGSRWREIPEGRDKMKVLKERMWISEAKGSLFSETLTLSMWSIFSSLWGGSRVEESKLLHPHVCLWRMTVCTQLTLDNFLSLLLFPSGLVRGSVSSNIWLPS